MVGVMVNEIGNVTNEKVISGLDAELDNEIVRIIFVSPQWISFNIDDSIISITYTLPFNF